ncbi:MAG: L7Ae/L30e/S12e/Gadd45 family ribosomal protein [Anaerovoracaceae bacterium]|jgi:ribosomal protein L7Ae-like RNA K-turn-binding protein
MREKIHSYLGFARKAGNLISGYKGCEDAIKRGRAYLIIIGSDISRNTADKFKAMGDERGIPFRIYKDKESLSNMTGLYDRGVFAITDEKLSEAILKEIDGKGQKIKFTGGGM